MIIKAGKAVEYDLFRRILAANIAARSFSSRDELLDTSMFQTCEAVSRLLEEEIIVDGNE